MYVYLACAPKTGGRMHKATLWPKGRVSAESVQLRWCRRAVAERHMCCVCVCDTGREQETRKSESCRSTAARTPLSAQRSAIKLRGPVPRAEADAARARPRERGKDRASTPPAGGRAQD